LAVDRDLLYRRAMSNARPVVPGSVLLSTRRIHKRQFLLRPNERINQLIEYVVAVLTERHGIELHAVCAMSNHLHDVATDVAGRIVEFRRDLHSILARAINAMHGEFESIWSRAQTSLVTCVDSEDVIAKIAYTMSNPVAALLVERGHHWPGVRGAWPKPPRVVSRPPGFFRDQNHGGHWPETATLRFHRPPGYGDLTDDEVAAILRNAIQEQEEAARARARREGRRFLGRRAVRDQSRHAFPASCDQRFAMRPTVAARSRGARVERLLENRAWREMYEAARDQYRHGDAAAVFPYGTWKLRVYYGVTCRPKYDVTTATTAARLALGRSPPARCPGLGGGDGGAVSLDS
jgi:REP element-mobilizing transposase RayT